MDTASSPDVNPQDKPMGPFWSRGRSEVWTDHVVITYVDKYEECGCDFSGYLVVVDCMVPLDEHPHYGKHGAMATVDVTQEAKRIILERHPTAVMLLGFPATVMRIDATEWTERRNVD